MTTADTADTADTPLESLVYSSAASTEFDDAALADLLAVSRRNNAESGLTGLLLYRDGHFLQVLEGPTDAVRARMTVISGDPRHENVRVLLEEGASSRWFPEWTMGYEPVSASLAATIPGYRATFDDIEGGDDLESPATIRALRALIEWFADPARRERA